MDKAEKTNKVKKQRTGLGLRLVSGVIFALFAVVLLMPVITDPYTLKALTGSHDEFIKCIANPAEYSENFFDTNNDYEPSAVDYIEQDVNNPEFSHVRKEYIKKTADGEIKFFVDYTAFLRDKTVTVNYKELSFTEEELRRDGAVLLFGNYRFYAGDREDEFGFKAFKSSGYTSYYGYLKSLSFTECAVDEHKSVNPIIQKRSLFVKDGALVLEVSDTYEIYETDLSETFNLQVLTEHYYNEDGKLFFTDDAGKAYECYTGSWSGAYSSYRETAFILFAVSAGFLILSVLSFILAFAGKKHKWANIVCIVINGAFCATLGLAPFAIWGLVGGIVGLKRLLPPKEKKKVQPIQNAETLADVSDSEEIGGNVTANEAKPTATLAKSANKKKAWIMFGIAAVYYVALVVLGVLSLVLPEKGIAFGPYDDLDYTVAMNVCAGFIVLISVPSFGYYFAFKGPFNLSRKVRAVIVSVCLGLTVAGTVAFYIAIPSYLKAVGFDIKAAPVLSSVGLILVYLSGFLSIAPEKLAKSSYQKTGHTFRDILGEIVCALKNLMKFLMRHRNKPAFVLCGTLLFTLCTFVVAKAFYVLISVAVILLIISIIESLYMPPVRHTFFITDDLGQTAELKYDSYNGFTGEDIYVDGHGNRYATTDGGKTFYKA